MASAICIITDKVTMVDLILIGIVDKSMQELKVNNAPVGGCLVIFGGGGSALVVNDTRGGY